MTSSFLVLPVLLAAVGLIANSLMVSALLAPANFVGLRPIFGWQGLIPARAATIAPRLVDAVLARVGTLRDVYEAADPDRIAEHLVYSLRPRMAELVEDVFLDVDPRLWDRLDDDVKKSIADRLEEQLPRVVKELLDEIEERLEEVIDVDYLTKVHLIDDRPKLIRLVQAVGDREFIFIRRFGLVIGLFAGLVAALAHSFEARWWVAALLGFVVFGLGSLLTVQLIFGWTDPKKIGPIWFHGLFYQNQDVGISVAVRIVTRDIITIRNLVKIAVTGPSSDVTQSILTKHATPLIQHAIEPARATLLRSYSPQDIERLEHELTAQAIDIALEPLDDPTFNRERQIVLEEVFVHKMMDLTGREWSELVLPALGGGEKILPPASAIVGFVAGGVGGAAAELVSSALG